jgi:hypothetical protein
MITMDESKLVLPEELYNYVMPSAPKRSSGANWKPMHHAYLVKALKESLAAQDVGIVSEQYQLFREDGHGLLAKIVTDLPITQEFGAIKPTMGLIHANDCSIAAKVSYGVEVLVCANGLTSTEWENLFRRKHTTGADVYEVMQRAVTAFKESTSKIPRLIRDFTQRHVGMDRGDHLIAEMMRERVLPKKAAVPAFDFWRSANRLAETSKVVDRTNAFNLLNCCTRGIREIPSVDQVKAIGKTQAFIINNTVIT